MTMQTLGLQDLIGLVDDLRLSGYDIGTQQYIDAQRLLIALAAHDRHPSRLSDLGPLLAPVLCSSPKEQENFYLHFPQWLERQPHLSQQADDPAVPDAGDPPPKSFWRRPRFYLPLAAAALLGAIFICLRLLSPPAVTLTGVVVAEADGTPVQGATVGLKGLAGKAVPSATPVITGSNGSFAFTYSAREAPAGVEVSSEGFESGTALLDTPGSPQPLRVVLRRPPATPAAAVAPSPDRTAGVMEAAAPRPPATPTPQTSYTLAASRLLDPWVVFLPLLLFAVWWLWRFYRHRRMLLRKGQSARPPRPEQLTVAGAAEQLFQGQTFRRIVQELRRHRPLGALDLDERVTIEATIRRGGLFTPSYGSRRMLPEYLVLIEQLSAGDQQARFHEELVRRLVQDNIIADVYHFRGDPRICRKVDERGPRPGNHLTLSDLAALHPGYSLLIFSDGASFINPITGAPEKWLEMFWRWSGRAILTPRASANWRQREWALRESDFLVLPGGREGLEELSEALGESALLAREATHGGHTNPFPEVLREQSYRWLEDHEPPPEKVGRLFEQLEAYLGADGLNWLAACAVYPTLQWDITLYLGFELIEDREEFEGKLLLLVSLPWLRHGVMPDWFRFRLVSALPPAAEQAVRVALEKLLLSAVDAPPGGVRLDYSMRREEVDPTGRTARWGRLRRWLRALGSRRKLREHFRTEGVKSPLYDFVFLTFMAGRRPRRLDLSVPDLLRRTLFPHGLEAFGLRPAVAFACALLLTLAAWAATRGLRPSTRSDVVTRSYAESYFLKPSGLSFSADQRSGARFQFSIEKRGGNGLPAQFPGLKAEDISVTIDGRAVPVDPGDLSRTDRRTTGFLILLDSSGSMNRYIPEVQSIVKRAVGKSESDETIALGVFAEDVRWLAEPTADKSQLIDSLARYRSDLVRGQYTSLYEAIETAVQQANEWNLRNILIITDGLENSLGSRELSGDDLANFKLKKEEAIARLLNATGVRIITLIIDDRLRAGYESQERGTPVNLLTGTSGNIETYRLRMPTSGEVSDRYLTEALEIGRQFSRYEYALEVPLSVGPQEADATHELRITATVGTTQRIELPFEYQYHWLSGSGAPFVYPVQRTSLRLIAPAPPTIGLDSLVGIYLLVVTLFGVPVFFSIKAARARETTHGGLAGQEKTLSERARDALSGEGRGRRRLVLRRRHFIAVLGMTAFLLTAWFGGSVVWRSLQEERRLSAQVDGVVVNIPAAVPQGMTYVPGGQFYMGRDDGDQYERPAHMISVEPFFIDRYEVTCEEYQRFIRSTGRRAPPGWVNDSYPPGSARLPVTGVDWDDAVSYAAWAGKRLPTEAEWEFAARGDDRRLYPWGNEWGDRLANANRERNGLAEVAFYKGVSPFGVYDMAGNAWEWTADSIRSYPGGSIPDDALPTREKEILKVIRGGCYLSDTNSASATYRRGWPARGSDYSQTGFRCVKGVSK